MKTLAESLALPAGAELDATVANALGDDLKAREEEITDILTSCFFISDWSDSVSFVVSKRAVSTPSKEKRERDEMLMVWQTREVNGVRKPYAAALEAAVAAYRRPAPKYSTDGNAMLDLSRQMKERGFSNIETYGEVGGGFFKCEFYGEAGSGSSCGDTEPLSRCRAALAALKGGD